MFSGQIPIFIIIILTVKIRLKNNKTNEMLIMSLTCQNTKATWIYAIHHALEHQGIDSEALFAKHGIQLNMLRHTQEQVPKQLVNQLWLTAIEATNDDAFCLSMLDYFNAPYINGLASAAQASENIHQALNILSSFYTLLSPEIEMNISFNTDIEIKIQNRESEYEWVPEDVDITFALLMKHGASLPVHEIKPHRLRIARPTPKQYKKYEEFFGCPVEFDSKESVLSFPIESLSLSIPSANANLLSQLEKLLQEKYDKQFSSKLDRNLSLRVRRYLFNQLGQDFPNLNAAASHFHMSISAFKKHLQAEECNFQLLCDEVRRNEACRLITKGTLSLKEIAYQLGFANSSAFNRAFKRWMSISPSDYSAAKKPLKERNELPV